MPPQLQISPRSPQSLQGAVAPKPIFSPRQEPTGIIVSIVYLLASGTKSLELTLAPYTILSHEIVRQRFILRGIHDHLNIACMALVVWLGAASHYHVRIG